MTIMTIPLRLIIIIIIIIVFLCVHLFLRHLQRRVIHSPRTTQPVYENASTHVVQRETVQNCATVLLTAIGVSKIRIIFH